MISLWIYFVKTIVTVTEYLNYEVEHICTVTCVLQLNREHILPKITGVKIDSSLYSNYTLIDVA